ncbi:unnamed protein product [Gongylonema pulchrum]|uniref:Cyclic pyranopterin monophosphate synthase n=1 Tax=Gongylonema pulchrum TaxID=637853 RepID=A0A183DP91_9BILA|nr:unnamed protein product [Gongylonema pulchrum]
MKLLMIRTKNNILGKRRRKMHYTHAIVVRIPDHVKMEKKTKLDLQLARKQREEIAGMLREKFQMLHGPIGMIGVAAGELVKIGSPVSRFFLMTAKIKALKSLW